MAPEKSSAGEKTEEATPRRREQARKKGQVVKSHDFNAAFNLFALVLVLYALQDKVSGMIYTYGGDFFSNFLNAEIEKLPEILLNAAGLYFKIMLPVFVTAFVIALVSNLAQIGFVFTLDPLKPSFDRLNLIKGMQNIFSLRTIVGLVKNIVKISVIGFIVFTLIKKKIVNIFALGNLDIPSILLEGKNVMFSITFAVIITYMAIAIADLMYERHRYKKNLKMTKQEVKEEFKQTEGNQEIKSKQKEMQRRLLTRRMIQEVPKATVVITNPTHLAVAIKYIRKEMAAPIVVAKGADLLAEKIKQVAEENDIPLIENRPVAQFLYRQVEVGDSIPEELYQAVAEIIAVVYQKHKKNL